MVIYGYEVDGDIWIWSGWWYMDMKWMVIYGYEVPGGTLNICSSKLPRPWSPWGSSPSRKYPHCRNGNRTRDLMINSRKLWPLDHEAGWLNNWVHWLLFYKICITSLKNYRHCIVFVQFYLVRYRNFNRNRNFIASYRKHSTTQWNLSLLKSGCAEVTGWRMICVLQCYAH
jgi:hypothetical protein